MAAQQIPAEVSATIAKLRHESAEAKRESDAFLGQANIKFKEAQTKLRLADELSQTYGIPSEASQNRTSSKASVAPTIEKIREHLKHHKGRVSHVAKHFQVKDEVILNLINSPESRVSPGPRGWLQVNLV